MKKKIVILILFLIIAPTSVNAQGFAVSGQVGTTGLGGGVIIGINQKFNLRGMFGLFPGEAGLKVNNIDFTITAPEFFLTTVDFYPVSGFHVSAGGLIIGNGGNLKVKGKFEGRSVEFGNTTYTGGATDEIVGVFSLKSFQPYLGVGFGNAIGKLIGINLDAGLGFGKPSTVTLNAQGPLASAAGDAGSIFRANVQAEIPDIEADIPVLLRFYPVIVLSISIGF